MLTFTDVYDKSRQMLGHRSFGRWIPKTEGELISLFDESGPRLAQAGALDTFRKELQMGDSFWTGKPGALSSAPGAAAAAIFGLAKAAVTSSSPKLWELAALLKMMKHTYLVTTSENAVWVADNPKSYTHWIYDEFAGKSEHQIKELLRDEDEYLGPRYRELWALAFQLARKWIWDIRVKLMEPSNLSTLAVVNKIFINDGNPTSTETTEVQKFLLDGFMKLSNFCNSRIVILADIPPGRREMLRKNSPAMVLGKPSGDGSLDRLSLIYVAKEAAFGYTAVLMLGGVMAALTIIHELTHKILLTEDLRYFEVLPTSAFSPAMAKRNATNWEAFAADLLQLKLPASFSRK